jgi:hypothetical protein
MKDPKGPVKSYKTPEEIAKKHKVSLDKIIQQVKMGTKVEGEHTTSKSGSKITALQHVDELPDYYSKLKKVEKIKEGSLHQWFKGSSGVTKTGKRKPGWVQSDGSPCANEPGETKTPKCFSNSKLASMEKGEIASAVRRKREQDPGQQSKSSAAKPTYVSTDKPEKKKMNEESDNKGKGSGKKDACYSKVKARFKVWPSAYGSGALVKCRKAGAANWGNKSEEVSVEQQYEKDTKYCLLCRKNEKREECSYGPMMWDRYTIAKIHPTNESKIQEDHKEIASGEKKDEEGYMARVEFDQIEKAISILKKNIKKGNQQIPAWVQSKITKAADYIDTAADYMDSDEEVSEACWAGFKQVGMKKKGKKMVPNCVPEDTSFTINPESHNTAKKTAKIRNLIKSPNENESSAAKRKLSGPKLPLTDSIGVKSFDSFLNEASAAWQRKEGKNPEGGLNAAGVASYRAQNPGSKLQTAVTTPPSKLKPGSKSANRRKSFCARMGGMRGPMKDEKGKPTRKALSLRKWNC